MKQRRLIMLTVITGGVLSALLLLNRDETPLGAFERHFGDHVPESVSDIAVSGFAALAGSDEILTFSIALEDLEELLKQRKFSEVTNQIETGVGTGISSADWQLNFKKATDLGVVGSRFFEISNFDGMVYHVVIADTISGRVYYRYFKT